MSHRPPQSAAVQPVQAVDAASATAAVAAHDDDALKSKQEVAAQQHERQAAHPNVAVSSAPTSLEEALSTAMDRLEIAPEVQIHHGVPDELVDLVKQAVEVSRLTRIHGEPYSDWPG